MGEGSIGFFGKIKSFLIKCKRVLLITKKPGKEEYKTIAKVTGVGIVIIGLIGFIISLLWQVVK